MKKINDLIFELFFILLIVLVSGYTILSPNMFVEDQVKAIRKLNKSIKLNDEFLLFECKTKGHPNEKLFLTLNNIYEDDNGKLFLDFTYRFKSDEPISIESFYHMQGFAFEIVGPNGGRKRVTEGISLDFPNIEIHNEFKNYISNNDIIRATYSIDMSKTKLKDYNLEDFRFVLINSYMQQPHEGSGIIEYFDI